MIGARSKKCKGSPMPFSQTIPMSTQARDVGQHQGRRDRSTNARTGLLLISTLLLTATLFCCTPRTIQGQSLTSPATQEPSTAEAPTWEEPAPIPVAPTVALLIDEAASYYGLTAWERARAHSIARCESGETADAYNRRSGAAGAFQFIPSTALSMGIDPWNVYQNVYAAIGLMADDQWQHWAACDPFAYTYRRR